MRLITYASNPAAAPRIGVRVGHRVLDIEGASRVDGEPLPNSMKGLLREGRGALARVQALARKAQSNAGRLAGALFEERSIRFLPPVPDPERLLCVDANDAARAQEPGKNGRGDAARAVTKLNSCLVGHDAKVAIPPPARRLVCEPAFVFVVGRRALGVKGEEAMDCVVGVTLLNDFVERDMQPREAAPGESSRTCGDAAGFTPLGPEIVTMDEIADPYDLWITCSVNGEERLRASTREAVSRLPAILEHFSRTVPIEPGDMFSIGARGGVAAGKADASDPSLKPGDVVECALEGLTTLRTLIVAPSA